MGVLGWGEECDLLVWSPKTGGSLLCSHQLCKLGWVCKFFWLPSSSFVRQDQVISYPTEPWWVAHEIAHVWYLAFYLEHNKLPKQVVYFFLKIFIDIWSSESSTCSKKKTKQNIKILDCEQEEKKERKKGVRKEVKEKRKRRRKSLLILSPNTWKSFKAGISLSSPLFMNI